MGNLFDTECKDQLKQCKKNNMDVRHLLLDLNQLIRDENVTSDTLSHVIDNFVAKIPIRIGTKKYSYTNKGGRTLKRNGFI